MPVPGKVSGLGQYLQNYQVEPNQWMRNVLDGQYLLEEGNPYRDQMVDSLRREYERSLAPIDARFAQGGRYGSGALGSAHAQANEGFNTGVGNLFGSLWESERGRMTDVLGMLSGENIAARQGISGFAGALQQALAAVKQAKIGASAQRYTTDRTTGLGYANLRERQRQNQFGNLASLFNIAGTMNQGNINQRTLPAQMLQGYSDTVLPILGGFGTQTQTQTGGGANVSPIGMGIQQGIGGAITGQGLQNMYGRRG